MLAGIVTGISLHYISSFLITILGGEFLPKNESTGKALTSDQPNLKKKLRHSLEGRLKPVIDEAVDNEATHQLECGGGPWRKSLASSTILEEDESSNTDLSLMY